MTLHKIIKKISLHNSVLLGSGSRFRLSRLLARSCSASPETVEKPEENAANKKVIKVAILGRPNAGKSTLINRILNKTICDVSCKTHTTRMPLRAALTVGDTQIIFVDTPGVVTKEEYKKFDLSETFIQWKKKVFSEVDIVGVIHEAQRLHETHNFSIKLIHCLHELPKTTPMFLIVNKIDLVKKKEQLIKASKRLLGEREQRVSGKDLESLDLKESENPKTEEKLKSDKQTLKERFSKVFFISALENIGVGDIVTYLLEQAKEGEWVLPADKHCDMSLHKLILNLIRAEMMDFLSYALPYSLKFQIELLEENDLGLITCVVLVKCQKDSEKAYLLSRRFNRVKTIARKVESDLYNIFQKDFRITIVVADKTGKV